MELLLLVISFHYRRGEGIHRWLVALVPHVTCRVGEAYRFIFATPVIAIVNYVRGGRASFDLSQLDASTSEAKS